MDDRSNFWIDINMHCIFIYIIALNIFFYERMEFIMKKRMKSMMVMLLAVIMVFSMAGCGSKTTSEKQSVSDKQHPGKGATKLGVLLVGARDDMGYNEAVYDCVMGAVDATDLKEVLVKDNVPEDNSVVANAEELIAQGCTIIYGTSIGHREYLEKVAEDHPEVAFYTNNSTGKDLSNMCVITPDLWDAAYVNGVVAGMMTKSNELGYVASFQIPVVLSSINAFALGAQSVNPDVKVHAIFTGSWSDVGLQTNAVDSMAAQNIDVIAQFQDYSKAIVEHCEEIGVYCIGYHCDTSKLAPKTFLIGTVDEFGLQYKAFQATIEGNFEATVLRGGYKEEMCKNTAVSDICPKEVKDKAEKVIESIKSGKFTAFEGPIMKSDGTYAYKEGETATGTELDGCDYFVKGVVGKEN